MTVNKNKEITDKDDPAYYDWIPAVLRSTAGFNSCMTVAVTSIIFIMTIYHGVIENEKGWFNSVQMVLMLCGPVIIAWNFSNAKSILSTVLTIDDSETIEQTKKEIKIPQTAGVVTDNDIAIERELFGLSTVLMRAVAGCISVHVICFVSIVFTITIRQAAIDGKALPGDIEVLLAVIGPVITSWSFVRAANTLAVLMSSGSSLINLREKLADIIRPNK